MFKKTVVALALCAGLAANASAVTGANIVSDIGTINAPATFSQIIQHGVGSFLDTWNFTIPSNTFATGSVSNLSIKLPGLNLYNIADLAVNLYSGTDNSLISNLNNSPGSTADLKIGSGTFTPGKYFFTVGGHADGNYGGQYVFAVSALPPVPEPETYAMLLAGLGLMGTIARRRSKKEA